MSRLVCGVRGRRISGRRSASKSGRRSMNARQKESARSKLATLKKLYKHNQKAKEKPQQLQHMLQSVLVMLQVPCVGLVFMRNL